MSIAKLVPPDQLDVAQQISTDRRSFPRAEGQGRDEEESEERRKGEEKEKEEREEDGSHPGRCIAFATKRSLKAMSFAPI